MSLPTASYPRRLTIFADALPTITVSTIVLCSTIVLRYVVVDSNITFRSDFLEPHSKYAMVHRIPRFRSRVVF